jgi:elongation factor G
MAGETAARSPRVVALVGPSGSGKSTLFEALLEAAGSPARRPADPRNRPATTETRVGHCRFLGDEWAILDCPGSVEFAHETACAVSVADIAVVVCDPSPARALTAAPVLRLLAERQVPHLVLINRIDTLEAGLAETLAALQAQSRRPLALCQVPMTEAGRVTGYVDLVSARAYRYRSGKASEMMAVPSEMQAPEQEALDKLVEVLADHDDALLEKVLEDVKPTPAELYADLRRDLAAGHVVEVLLGAGAEMHGVRRLWKKLRHDTPFVDETAARIGVAASGAVLAQVFRTQHAGHAGKLSFARVWRGVLRDGVTLAGGRLGGIQRFPGGEPAKIVEAQKGELVALGRLDGVATGDCAGPDGAETLAFPAPPTPVFSLAIGTTDRKDDVKLSGALQKLLEEDPSLSMTHSEAGETVLHGQGEIHLNVAIERLGRIGGLRLASRTPGVAYRETIRRGVREHGRLKRQTGGHGQFADVTIEIAPQPRGAGFAFIDRIVGGAVPRQFIPAVGEAAAEAAGKGPFGYPVVDIAVTLLDGQFHSVDSSDMAFRSATRAAMAEGLAKADPVLLEPIEHVTVSVPNEYTARAQRLLTGRRGQILGYAERADWPGWDDVEALVPAAELHDMIIELRSQTMGLGTFARRFDHLAESRAEGRRGAA